MMQHYSRDKWQQYISGELEEIEVRMMEDHLYCCDDCMAIYLSILETTSLPEAVFPSPNFTNNILTEIDLIPPQSKKMIQKFNNRNVLFKYYVVAASITIFLMYSGFFDLFMYEVPRATSEIFYSQNRIEDIVPEPGWSQRMLDSTFERLDSKLIKQGSDDVNED